MQLVFPVLRQLHIGTAAAARLLVTWLIVAVLTACAAPVAPTPAITPTPAPVGKLPAQPSKELRDTLPSSFLLVWETPDGPIAAIATPAAGSHRGVLLLSGADGGFNGPDSGLYDQLVRRLHETGVTALQVAYRRPTKIDPSVEDARVGLDYLLDEGVGKIAVVGFSFGGAVAIEAATQVPAVRAVLTLSSQNADTDRVDRLAPRPLAIIHAVDDTVVPVWAADDLFERAGEPKQLLLLPTADHYLTDADPALADFILDWLLDHLPAYDEDPTAQ